jgi:hypothetical protein
MTEETLLHRQVSPSWLQQGRITSQVFKPTPKDQGRLSVYDGDQITARASWEHYTTALGFTSVGVMAVSVRECGTQELKVAPDPTPFPSHVLISFAGGSNSQIESKAKRLKGFAENRGWQFLAETRA